MHELVIPIKFKDPALEISKEVKASILVASITKEVFWVLMEDPIGIK